MTASPALDEDAPTRRKFLAALPEVDPLAAEDLDGVSNEDSASGLSASGAALDVAVA